MNRSETDDEAHAPAALAGESRRDSGEILRERAAELAREAVEEVTADRTDAVIFELAGERYAVDSRYVVEVFPLVSFTPVPCTPDFVVGVASFRGRIVSIVDTKKFFDLPDSGITDLNRVVLLGWRDMEFGLLADSIVGAERIEADAVQPTVPTQTGVRADYTLGVTRDRLIVLNPSAMLSDPRIIVNEEV